MSLLQHEEFAIYQLRTAYLANIHDGIGERLINVNTAFLNDPAFKAAGWSANPAELKRTYSPPIPTAVTADYFQAPPSAGLKGTGLDDDVDEDGLPSGAGSNATVGPNLAVRRRRRREQLAEADSSDLSDDSDEDMEASQRPAGQIKFSKMPIRHRAGSSPTRKPSQSEEPANVVSSPSGKVEESRHRAGSLGAAGVGKPRVRRDTVTSSEVSSDNDMDQNVFKRRQIKTLGKSVGASVSQIKEEDHEPDGEILEAAVAGSESGDSLASGFSETLVSNSLLVLSSPLAELGDRQQVTPPETSPKKQKSVAAALEEFPAARPISTFNPVSALALAIKARNKQPTNPFERFAIFSGNGDSNPLYIKLYVPSASNLPKPLEIVLKKKTDDGEPVTVAEAIGFCLWKHGESGLLPPVAGLKRNVNYWTFRIVEDGDVDEDFPPLGRTRPITDFTFNNNRPARGRARDKPWDEMALIEADAAQIRDNQNQTPVYNEQAAAAQQAAVAAETSPQSQPVRAAPPPPVPAIRTNPITGPSFIGGPVRQNTLPADSPTAAPTHAVPRSGAPKTIKIHFTNNESNPVQLRVDTTTDTYIAEVFDITCKRLNIDKALYMLKVTGTGVVAPSDRTIEALGPERSSLDLIRKRFVGEGHFGLTGSPGSTSPNAPLQLATSSSATPRKGRKGAAMPLGGLHPLAQQYEPALPVPSGMNPLAMAPSANYKRYNVIRKQPMSFTPSHPRVLVIDGEYIHVMPGEGGGGRERIFDTSAQQAKITSIHCSSVVGCKVNRKHPKTFRIVVFRERESKRYDFEAASAAEAAEIVEGIKRGIEPYRDIGAG